MMVGIFNLQIAAARREFPATATLPTNFNLRITGSHAIISKAFLECLGKRRSRDRCPALQFWI